MERVNEIYVMRFQLKEVNEVLEAILIADHEVAAHCIEGRCCCSSNILSIQNIIQVEEELMIFSRLIG